jgi:hypothetical protein
MLGNKTENISHINHRNTIILFLVFTNFVFSDNEEIPLDSKDSQIIKKISVQQAREMIEATKGNNKLMILDLRTAEEHKLERIENSETNRFFSGGRFYCKDY